MAQRTVTASPINPRGETLARASSVQSGAMSLGLFLRLAWRNVGRHRRRTLIVVLAIALGLSLMMLYDGTVAGFEQAIYGNAIKVLSGNIQIHAQGYHDKPGQTPLLPLADDSALLNAIQTQPQVQTALRRISTGGMASNREGAFAVGIVGVEPERELPSSLIAKNVAAGRYLTASDQDSLYIGKGLAEAMSVNVGDRITLAGRAPHSQMRQRSMTIVGIYDIGMRDVEKRSVYMSLGEAQTLYDLRGQITEVVLLLQQIGQENNVIAALQPTLSQYSVDTWVTLFPDLERGLSSKNSVMNIFSFIILGIAGIGILNLLLMAVYERTREIGLLAALGLKPNQISLLFLLEGAMMGMIGVVVGIGLGLLFNVALGQVGMDYSKFANVTSYTALIDGRIYPTLGLNHLAQRAITALVIAILAAFYPAREAARSEPALALHHV